MTDPKETLNIRFEMCAVNMPNDVRIRPSWSTDWWHDTQPLHIEKLGSIVTVSDNLESASRFYKDVFGLRHLADYKVPEAGVTAASFAIGSDVPFVIEVWQPAEDGTPVADYVSKFGGGIFGVNFKVDSLSTAAEFLEGQGLRLVGDSERRVVIDPRDSYGVTFMMVEQEPGQA
jgi:catechol 2,3-dioxygenase-like lactoylglutathione lyase family enzyme